MGIGRGNVFTSNRHYHVGRWVALVLFFAIIGGAIFTVIDNGRIIVKTQRVLVSNLPQALEGFSVLHISDLNGHRFGPAQKQMTSALKGKRYNAVCVTGDMVGAGGDMTPFLEVLSAIDTTKPVYFITGDSDPTAVAWRGEGNFSVLAEWVLAAQSRGAVFLGSPASLQVGNATVWFTDAQQLSLDLEHAANAYADSTSGPVNSYYAGIVAETKAARSRMKEEDLHITLSHNPVGAEMIQTMQSDTMSDAGSFVRTVDLILAGGAVGGQWRLPLIGPVWADGRWFPGGNMAEGYHQAGSILEYISAGLGTNAESPLLDFRLFNTPEVSIITFTSQMGNDVLP